MTGYNVRNPETGFPVFAFRLHQFISRGDTVYASLEPEESRYLTIYRQQYVPGDRGKVLLPLAFCRECGQEYYSVRRAEVDVQEEVQVHQDLQHGRCHGHDGAVEEIATKRDHLEGLAVVY